MPRCDEQMSELLLLHTTGCLVGCGGGGGERFRDRGAVCCVSLPDVRSGLPRGASRLRVLLVVN